MTIYRIVLTAALLLVSPVIGGCGSKVEGTYSVGGVNVMVLELRSGGQATFTIQGDNHPCAYKVNGDKVLVDCSPNGLGAHSSKPWPPIFPPVKMDFAIHDDGSLTMAAFPVPVRKT